MPIPRHPPSAQQLRTIFSPPTRHISFPIPARTRPTTAALNPLSSTTSRPLTMTTSSAALPEAKPAAEPTLVKATPVVAVALHPPQNLPSRPRVFAPLGKKAVETEEDDEDGGQEKSTAPILRGVVFDVDGTLCEPQTYMFAEMRTALSIPKSTDILDHIYSLPTASAQETAHAAIRAIERTAMTTQVPSPGLVPLMAYLASHALPKGICTRNFDLPVHHLLTSFLPTHTFSPIITREFRPPKPDPTGILHIASTWGLESAEGLIMVGDSMDDILAGWRAGAATVLLLNDVNGKVAESGFVDLCIERLDELVGVLEEGFKGRGKMVVG